MNKLEGIRRLAKYVKRKKTVYLLFLIAMVVSILELVPAQLVSKMVDMLSEAQKGKALFYVVSFGVIYVLAGVIKNIYGNLVMSFNYNVIEEVRRDLFLSILLKKYNVNEKEMIGDIIARATGDVEQITRIIAGPLNGFVGKILTFLFSMMLLAKISPVLMLVSLMVSLMLLFMSQNISEKNKEYGKKERGIIGVVSQKLSDLLKNIVIIKAYQMEKSELEKLNMQSRELLRCRKNLLKKMTAYWSSVELCSGMGFTVAFAIVIMAVNSGKVSVGEIIIIYSYLQNAFASMVSISRYKTDMYNADAAMIRLFSIIPENVEVMEMDEQLSDIEEKIQRVDVKNLSIHITETKMVNQLSFTLQKGNMTVLIGKSGSGKTSIINVLLGFLEDFSGQILIDGKDYTDKPNRRRMLIRALFQNAYLFQRSLDENINYGGEKSNKLTLSKNIDISKIKQIHGMEAALDTKNGNLSGGEQRKIAIIRTLNKDVPIYIFDEPTAEMDLASSKQVVEMLKKLSKEAIVLVASHDDEVIRGADSVIAINE